MSYQSSWFSVDSWSCFTSSGLFSWTILFSWRFKHFNFLNLMWHKIRKSMFEDWFKRIFLMNCWFFRYWVKIWVIIFWIVLNWVSSASNKVIFQTISMYLLFRGHSKVFSLCWLILRNSILCWLIMSLNSALTEL